MLKLPWKRGPEWAANSGVFVSVTNFEIVRLRDLLGAYLAGLRLRRAWPTMTGAVGLRLWARPWKRRSGAISVWRTEADLHRFVSGPVHVAIMHEYRHRATVTSDSWIPVRFIAADIEREARRRLAREPLDGGRAYHSDPRATPLRGERERTRR
jgi:hypothetical protein